MPEKSRDAFRTISEVAEWLDTPAHVLRFWESKFPQVKPVKRAGGRRYYRPSDMALIGGIKRLLHDEGMTIKGVQKLLREQGVRHVASLSPPVDGPGETLEAEAEPGGTVLPFEPKHGRKVSPDVETAEAPETAEQVATQDASTGSGEPPAEERPEVAGPAAADETGAPADTAGEPATATPDPAEPVVAPSAPEPDEDQAVPAGPEDATGAPAAGMDGAGEAPAEGAPAPDDDAPAAAQADLFGRPEEPTVQGVTLKPAGDLPSFLRSGPRVPQAAPPSGAYYPPRPQPIRVNLPPDPEDGALDAAPGPLAQIARLRRLPPEAARAMQPHLQALADLHARRAESPRN
jgi:DNA-binding transcriptional MerR regulator